ncbi:hypothetical protein BUALT_Bualt07G0016500 [Buddleja alternifolia]|uniref:Uncharacterized protein n=1 Tax=Buddleja alternifolia TaxID=168488 RepID=A0AAV6XF45_9LAMI|nr:hypothetical protein BUALT_Bualt07G0016500 [Buddleja alternifolia]
MAYAAVVSLSQTLDNILHPDRHLILHHKKRFESLREKLSFLQQFLDKSGQKGGEESVNLATKIRDTSYRLEDIIEETVYNFNTASAFRILDLAVNSYAKLLSALQVMLPSSRVFDFGMEIRDRMFNWSYFRLEKLIREIDSIVEEVKEIGERCGVEEIRESLPAGPSRHNFSEKSVTVGLDGDFLTIMDRLTGSSSKLEVIPIVGMGGIGKTTLAQNVYTDPLIVNRFDARAWITVSQDYNVRDVLIRLLDSLGKLNDKVLIGEGDHHVAELLYKTLSGRRYLIVMDDLWSNDAWDDFRRFFPDNQNGSRVVLTTRLESVATYAGGFSSLHNMRLLGCHKSWELLRAKVFGEECCPPQLERVGKEIAHDCHGLPLAIVVIAGLLSKVNRTPDEWKNVAENLHSIVAKDADTILEILNLSYDHLPQHLKACFLYMGVFPEDCKISVSKIIKLWVAEGFLKQSRTKTVEEVAEEYLSELVERSLVLVLHKRHEKGHGGIKVIGIHDLLRDLCIREARKEKFLHVIDKCGVDGFREGMYFKRRISICPNISSDDPFFKCISILPIVLAGSLLETCKQGFTAGITVSLVRSISYTGGQPIPSSLYSDFKLLRVLDITQAVLFEFPMEIIELVNLRYLAFPYHGEIPESISKLWNLQTLIFFPLFKTFAPCPRPLPLAIWSMPRLRHLKFHVWYLSEFPCLLPGWKTNGFLENLQSLSEINASFCTKDVLQEVPNLKKLGIWMETWDFAPFYVNNLVCLNQLEVLKCSVRSFPTHEAFLLPDYGFPPNLAFPIGLKELTLRGCKIPWKDMTMVGSLPNLERLKLRDYAFIGPEWEPTEGEFGRLNFLLIDGSDLVHWRGDSTHFPVLRHLIVENCWKLESIPSDIGEISTLQIIDLDMSSPSAVTSAKQILEEQRDFGNDNLRVNIYSV